MNEFIYQSAVSPSRMLAGLGRLLRFRLESLSVCAAYTTAGGVALFSETAEDELGAENWGRLAKKFVTSFDYGITSPDAIRALMRLENSHVYIANSDVLDCPGFRPKHAFHPKTYCIHTAKEGAILTGSSNLTRRALTVNSEMAVLSDCSELVSTFLISLDSLPRLILADDDLLQRYEQQRGDADDPGEDSPPVPEEPPQDLPSYSDYVTENQGRPMPSRFWIEAGSMSSSGSHHQLELPRRGNVFFGFDFDDYGTQQEDIGTVSLIRGFDRWDGRRVVWHGDNGMERVYLPTIAEGGVSYVNQAILFERSPDVPATFSLTVASWESEVAESWRNASIVSELVFRIPQTPQPNSRICGLLH